MLPHQAAMKMTVRCSSTMRQATPLLGRPEGKLPALTTILDAWVSVMLILSSHHSCA